MKTVKVMTEWGELSIYKRGKYYYAVKVINGLKRQVYLGKAIPGQGRLEEVADEINQKADDWVRNHQRRHKPIDTNNLVSVAVDSLRQISDLAKARGECDISRLIDNVISDLGKL